MAEIQERTTPDAELAELVHEHVRSEEEMRVAQARYEAATSAVNMFLQGLAAHYKTKLLRVEDGVATEYDYG